MQEYENNLDVTLREDDLFARAAGALSPTRRGLFFACGSYILDAVSGREPTGISLLCSADTAEVSSRITREVGLVPVKLQGRDGVYHLAGKEPGGRGITVVPMNGGVERHLERAGFTVGAMAVDLAGSTPFELIDPLDGVRDLDAGCLCAASDSSVWADPARVLLAAHLCHRYGLYPEKRTRAALREAAPALSEVRPERTWRVIARLFGGRGLSWTARFLQWIGVPESLMPELAAVYEVPQNYYHHLGVWEHTLEVLDRLEEMMESPAEFFPAYGKRLGRHLSVPVESGVSRRSLLAFAGLIHDVGKPGCMSVEPSGRIRFKRHEAEGARLAADIAARLGLGYRARSRLVGLVRDHMRLGYLVKDGESAASRLEVVRQMGDRCPEAVILALADRMATRGEAATEEAMERFRRTAMRVLGDYYWSREFPSLVGGRDVLVHAGVPTGPEVARVLSGVRVAQREATVTNRRQALEFMAPDSKCSAP